MTDTHHDETHSDAVFKAYMVVAVALSIFTASSFFFNWLARRPLEDPLHISHITSFVLILGVAIIKATLVAVIFMHLKWDWKLLYFLIIPVFIMGAMMMMVLMPDILLGSMHDQQAEIEIARMEKGKP
jgi:cytochrome c oxidase subunit IV